MDNIDAKEIPLSEQPDPTDSFVPKNWGQERRLEFIDFRLRWDTTFNRTDLTSHFGISIPQASLDIAKYAQLAPQNLLYDRSSRLYRAGERFAPAIGNTEPQRYLNELLACSRGLLSDSDSYIGWRPPFAGVPVLTRLVEETTLSALLEAVRHQGCAVIRYQSDSEAEPVTRVISPHAFGHDGFRWHVRAYCFVREGYRDFVLGRIISIDKVTQPGRASDLDRKWHTTITLKIGANPVLTEGNRRAVELDYAMADGVTSVEVREALLYYVLKELGLGPFATGFQPAQIVLLNEPEIRPFIEQIRASRVVTRSEEGAKNT